MPSLGSALCVSGDSTESTVGAPISAGSVAAGSDATHKNTGEPTSDKSDNRAPSVDQPVNSPPFETYYRNQSELPTNRKMAVIVMMVADSENLMAIEGDSSSSIVTPELFAKNTRPYSNHLVKKG